MVDNLGHIGGLLITWHGFFTAVGIIFGVWLSARLAVSRAFDEDTAYTVGMIIVASGIIGARALYVIERYGDSPNIDSFVDIFKINEGGISIYGAILGGAIGGWAYGLWRKLACAVAADAAVFGMLLGLAIGRIGDVINGEHFAKTTDLPWGVVYTHPNSPSFGRVIPGLGGPIGAQHPAVAYEMIGDLVIMGLLAFLWRRNLKSGVVFSLAFLLYSVMRFFVSFLRIDSKEPLLGLSTPQLVAVIVMPLAALLALFFWRRREPGLSPAAPARAAVSRAEQRRRQRGRAETRR